MSFALSVRNLTKTFDSGSRRLTVLDDVSFDLADGATCAVVGPSGSGKTTLLGLAAGLDRPTSGTVELCGERLDALDEDERSRVRGESVGFIFQQFRLIPTLTALENVTVPLELRGVRGDAEAERLLARVGLGDRTHHYPTQLSGGEQQRVALARAFINRPRILFADEPTGNLDTETSETVEALLFDLNAEAGTALVVVTHDLDLAARTERVLRLRGGRLVGDEVTERYSGVGGVERVGGMKEEAPRSASG
ncbi:MAG: ABC transporter ATP-binding protein [Bacteroidota bacterium]